MFLGLFLISKAVLQISCKLELCLETSARHTVNNYLTSYYVQKQIWTTKTFLDGNLCYSLPPLLIHKFLRYRKFSETQKVSPTKFFGTMRQQIFDGKSWYPPSLLSLILFDTSIFLKHRRVLPRIFSVMWESFDGKSWCSLPPSPSFP